MGFSLLDYAIVSIYLIGVTIIGMYIGRRQRSSKDYFLGGKQMSWWSVGFSIVASETSTLTFISIPGLAYKSDMHFLQLAVGYFIGRLLVSVLFIPAYYKGDLETAYDFLGKRFGMPLRKFTSSVFIITRVLASGVRLFATAIPVHLITGYDYATSIFIIGIFTLVYTYVGGLKAVVAMDVVQMFIYLSGAVASMILILQHLPNGWSDVIFYATKDGNDKFSVINFAAGNSLLDFLSAPYTLLGGVLGGTFLSMASHGTDQLLVQRLLGCKSKWDSQRALMLDASVIVLQFGFFLVLGLCLFAFYGGVPFQQLGLKSSDEIFPKFIVENLPTGLAGLVIAGVLASAMGTLSSSISSLASSTFLDLFKFTARGKNLDEKTEVMWSKRFTLLWGILLIGGAMLFTDTTNPVVEIGLKIASFTYGGLLGTFFLGLLFKHTNQRDAYIGFIAGILTMTWVLTYTNIDFTWHTLIGCSATIIVGNVVSMIRSKRQHMKNNSSELLYGSICGIAMSAWTLVEYALGFHSTSPEIGQYSGFVSIIFPIVFIYVALHDRQAAVGTPLPSLEGINTGFRIAFFSALLFTIFLFVYISYINPEWIDTTIEWQRKKLILGGASDDEIGQFMDQNRQMNNSVAQTIMTFIGSTGVGVLITLLEIPIVRFLRKK